MPYTVGEHRHEFEIAVQVQRQFERTDAGDRLPRVGAAQRHGAVHVHAHARPKADFATAGGVSHQLSFMRALGL